MKRRALRRTRTSSTPPFRAVDKPAKTPLVIGVAAVWLVLAALEVALGGMLPGAGLRNGDLSIAGRVSLTALGMILLLPTVAAVAVAIGMTTRLVGRAPSGRWIAPPLSALVVWLVVLLWVASWATFWQTGAFLDRDALVFWASQPVQVFHWVYPPIVVALLVASVVLAALVGTWIPTWASARPAAVQRQLVRGAIGAATVCAVLAAGGGISGQWAAIGRPASPFSGDGTPHAGPIAHVLAQATRASDALVPPATASTGDLRVVRRPLVTLDQYVAGVDARRMRRFNVVMIQVESLRSDQLRAYGGTRDVMPTLDALASDARVFTRAYLQASHSNYAGLVPLSSHYPLRSPEMHTYPARPAYPRVLIYDILKALGYSTAVFSSQNENWGAMINYHRPSSLDRFFHAATFDGPTYTPWEDTGFADWVKQTEGAGSVDDRYTIDEALRWVGSLGPQPFFLHMNLQSSHLPYVVPPGFPRRFGQATLDFPIMWGKFPMERVADVKDRYADSLFYIDSQIARLFDGLQQHGRWGDTMIVIGGDNGEAFYEHGFSAHASWLFDEVVKVPMIVRVPGVAPGIDDRPAMFLDVPPTVLDALGAPPHPAFQGISLFAAQPDPERSLFIVAQTPAAYETAVVRGRFKLHWPEAEDVYILNDLVNDPGETIDVAPAHPDVVRQLARRLQQWRGEQLAYYADVERQRREYPPRFED